MARLTYGQKAQRVLVFLLALRHPDVAAALARFKFDDTELAKGFALLAAMSQLRMDARPPTDPRLLAELDQWENDWFPVIAAVLQYAAPEAHDFVFLNLTQQSGPGVLISVSTLLQRLEKLPLPKSEGGLGREGRAARELLERRGLTDAEIHNAQQILDVIGKIAPAPAPARDIAAEEEAEKAMWAWYLQWSAIARVAVKERKLLKLMGYRKTATGQVVEPEVPEDGEEDTEDDEDIVTDSEPVEPAPEEPEPAPV